MSLAAGTKLGPYEIVAPLGAGGMGEVEPFCGRERSAFFCAPEVFAEREPAGEIPSNARDLMLTVGTKLGPYEIQAHLAPAEWVKSIARGTRGWSARWRSKFFPLRWQKIPKPAEELSPPPSAGSSPGVTKPNP